MIQWSLSAELLSFILIIMTALFCYDKNKIRTKRMKLFEACLLFTGLTIAVNFISILCIEHFDSVPYAVCIFFNSLYFLIIVWACTLIAAYLFDLLLEHVYDKSCRTKAYVGLTVLFTANLILVLGNPWTHLIFWFDETGLYHRGPLVNTGYVILLCQLAMLLMCYHRNRRSVERKVKRVMLMLPPIVSLLALFQVLFPELILNGTNMSFALLIIFINFQKRQFGQDGLTGTGNRRALYEELNLRLKSRQDFQILLISLSDFTSVNHRFGYERGDEFLYQITTWLVGCCPTGKVFRFSNVTFALLCPYLDDAESDRLLTVIKERFERVWQVGNISSSITAHIGSMNCKSGEKEPTQVIEALSMMTDFAKQNDLQIVSYNKEMDLMFQRKKWLKELLQDSIEGKRFEVWYQPIFNCQTKQFESAEALIRLRDYEGKLISPADFIPLAEENGSIEDIGWFVWEEVCRFLGAHKELPFRYVSINMSIQQFNNPDLHDRIADCLARNGLTPDSVKMEITERVIACDMKYMKQQMELFSTEGLKFCVDDFGTGYSNFSTVMHLPFEYVKLDRSLIEKLTQSSQDQLVVTTLINLFHTLGLKIIAEGIETAKQQEMLQQMGADYIQGFYYARPMPEAEVVEFLR